MKPPPLFSRRPRLLTLLAVLLAAIVVVACVDGLTPRVAAQAEGGGEGAGAAGEKGPAEIKVTSFEVALHTFVSISWVFKIILGLCSIALVTLIVLLALELRMGAAVPLSFVEDFTETVNKRRFKEAYEMAKDDSSYVARVLAAGMARLQYGIEDAREASFSMLESVKAGKEQLIVYLATIGALGPLLGLVGTVWSMIGTFMVMGKSTGGLPANVIAEKISEGLGVTLIGIGMSLPAIFFHAFFKNRLTRLTHEAGTVADDLLTQMYYNSKKAASAAPEPEANARPASTPSVKK
jgi:biopolymer transport protein ExbB